MACGCTDGAEDGRPLRADAERNRLRIVAAAKELFAERGLEVSLDDVAAAAGVGVGTVYRRFANRDELIAGVFAQHLRDVSSQVSEALDAPDPWTGVVDLMTWFGSVFAEDRGLGAIMMRVDHSHPDIEPLKKQLVTGVESVFDRAVTAGAVRPGVVNTDFFGISMMLSEIARNTEATVPGLWRRYLEIMLEGIRADADRGPLHTPPMTDDQVYEIQQALGKRP